MRLRWLQAGLLGVVMLGLGPVSRAQDVKERTQLLLRVEASTGVNPDDSQRAYPIKVRLYELKEPGTFAEADYFSLDTTDKTILIGDLLARDEFILRPGESRVIERKSHPQTQYLGVLAGYRDLARSNWRVVHKMKEAPTAAWWRATIPLNRLDMTVQLQPQGIVLIVKP